MDDLLQIADWQKVSELGSGAFGVVSLWKNVDSNEFIAIKKCKFQMASSLTPKQKSRWKKEVDIMKIIKHQNVISFKDIPSDLEKGLLKNNPTKLPLLSMEYCQKGNLRHLLQKPKNISGMEEREIRCILKDIASGLEHLHNLNITHRDIKPDNIVLQHCNHRKGNTVYKIIDLGYAKELNDSTVSFVGTLHYLAPEIFETLKYDSSVDYWSMGIMTFEIICGVLPFLPHLSPPQRFADVKRKGPDDICIYVDYTGQVIYSTELKKEILVTSCFKEHIEEWLRHVLQFDPVSRARNFPNGAKVFAHLQQILNKKIIKVFALHKFEFYSYEIDDSTLIGTLKDWISRDIKISKTDLILLFRNDFFSLDDQLLISVLDCDDYVFVINRNGLVFYPITYNFPKLIKEVMQSALKFNHSYLRQLYAQTVYYITIERITANLFRCGLQYYVGYLKQTAENLRKKYHSVSKKLGNLLVRVDCCTYIRKNNISDIGLRNITEFKNCLIDSQKLLDSLQEKLNYYRDFKTKIDKTFKRLSVLVNIWPKIVELVNNYNLIEQYDRVINLLETSERGKTPTLKKEIIVVVSQTIRLKDTLFRNQTVVAYLSGMANVEKNMRSSLLWLQEYDKTIQNLSEVYMKNEVSYWVIRIRLTKEQCENTEQSSHDALSSENMENAQSCELDFENSSILNKFEELMTENNLGDMTTSLENITS